MHGCYLQPFPFDPADGQTAACDNRMPATQLDQSYMPIVNDNTHPWPVSLLLLNSRPLFIKRKNLHLSWVQYQSCLKICRLHLDGPDSLHIIRIMKDNERCQIRQNAQNFDTGQMKKLIKDNGITFLKVSTWLNWVMRNVSEAEMWFNAVERVEDYTKLTQEPYHKPKGESVCRYLPRTVRIMKTSTVKNKLMLPWIYHLIV